MTNPQSRIERALAKLRRNSTNERPILYSWDVQQALLAVVEATVEMRQLCQTESSEAALDALANAVLGPSSTAVGCQHTWIPAEQVMEVAPGGHACSKCGAISNV